MAYNKFSMFSIFVLLLSFVLLISLGESKITLNNGNLHRQFFFYRNEIQTPCITRLYIFFACCMIIWSNLQSHVFFLCYLTLVTVMNLVLTVEQGLRNNQSWYVTASMEHKLGTHAQVLSRSSRFRLPPSMPSIPIWTVTRCLLANGCVSMV